MTKFKRGDKVKTYCGEIGTYVGPSSKDAAFAIVEFTDWCAKFLLRHLTPHHEARKAYCVEDPSGELGRLYTRHSDAREACIEEVAAGNRGFRLVEFKEVLPE